ncbi:MAG TPA: YkgJ family cysteine cluster protein [Sphaerochaeta sp.]|nr:YkgJ family cysteine cluster protein [Sphaerochaeta sp.]
MDSIGEICAAYSGTFAGEGMASLATLYDQIEMETSRFCFEHSIACGPGCGTCCEHFMPDITALEARLVAAYLLLIKKDTALIYKLVDAKSATSGPCPLYQSDSPYHCSVYPARPLICRLFGVCANGDKSGNGVFRRCRYNGEETMPRHLTFGPEVPVMQDYAYALRALDSSAAEVALLPKAVLGQLEQLSFLSAMLTGQHDDSNPDDTPNPQAS